MGDPVTTGAAITGGASLLGGIAGGKKQKATQESRPYLPDNYQKGFDSLLERGTAYSEKPFDAVEKQRVNAPQSAYEALFASPEMLKLQQMSDMKALQGVMNPAPAAAAPQPQAPQMDGFDKNTLLSQIGVGGVSNTGLNMPHNRLMTAFQKNAPANAWQELNEAVQKQNKGLDPLGTGVSTVISKYSGYRG